MKPVLAVMIGAILIALGIFFSVPQTPWAGLVLGVSGVATVLVGFAMLVGIAEKKGAQ